ncbi:cell division protein FtsK/SpoIIIE [Thermaerobacter marianensis DSM 12885]|uniref:Cell division protein FtsK/SpoIIIE n=1 Tax=Thermaerobacter marianensis (strain ATCC 700841 / DSM 12885 / JCM 10246 / 7p75a) TaxID=644966 RepID=E6SK13_THEM7|nr:DNA translocase FtsK [Thermaerobacter marianensis]ADU51154.1 cell division protein FtsK/SpoIIIE [Thermaerobacter marianensis DSM 12885]
MARRKTRHKQPAQGEPGRLRSEVGAIALLVAAAAAALALAGGPAAGGVVGTQLAAGLRWVLGRAAWVLPPLMALRALGALLAASGLGARSRQAGFGLAVVLVAVAVARPCPDLWSSACFRAGGGVVGTAAGWLLARAFGATGALVAWAALGVLAVRLITGVPLAAMAAAAGRGLAAAAAQLGQWAAGVFVAAEGEDPRRQGAAPVAGREGAGARGPVPAAAGWDGGGAEAEGRAPGGSATAGAAAAGAPRRSWWRRWGPGGRRETAEGGAPSGPGTAVSGRPGTGAAAGAAGGATEPEGQLRLPGLERLIQRAFGDGAELLDEAGEGAAPPRAGTGAAAHGGPEGPGTAPGGGTGGTAGASNPGGGASASAAVARRSGAGAAAVGTGEMTAAPDGAGSSGPGDPGTAASLSAEEAASGGRTGTGAAGEGHPVNPGGTVPAPAYRLPPLELLSRGRQGSAARRQREILEKAAILQETLASFGVQARIVDVAVGPAVTRFEVEPARGVKVSKIQALASDIALSLAAPDVRIEAPIPGKAAVGIEVPNREIVAVQLRDVLETPEFARSRSKLTVALGQDIAGQPVVTSLDKLVHVLIAGATGSGKSVCINALIASLLFKARPDEVKLLLIDPKVVELSAFNGIPHLIAPVITDARKAAGALQWAVREMERRYELFARTGVRDVSRYNQRVLQEGGAPLPLMVVVIDELADLMMVAPVEVEDAIQRLAQMARASGIHLVVATQRPSVDVITGVIKANIPSRIAFAVSSQTDSRVILDLAGAEKLVGRGDMLFMPVGATKPVRVQGAFISEKDLDAVLAFLRRQARPEYDQDVMRAEVEASDSPAAAEDDDLFTQAVRVVLEAGQASVSLIQRRLRVGYTRAGRLIDMMEERGYIGPHQGAKPRDVLITWEEFRRRHGDGGLPPGMPPATGAGAP